MPAMRVCSCTGCPAHPSSCPELVTKGRCGPCAREAELKRGSSHQRGYGRKHVKLREQWQSRVATGSVRCARGDHFIDPAKPWALDHTDDRTGYLGPSCATCNNRAGGQAAHR